MNKIKKDFSIKVGNHTTKPVPQLYKKSIASCHAYLTLREDWREQVREVQKNIGFEYMRFHGIFMDMVGVYSESAGKPVYNFVNVDKIYDFLLDNGCKPFVEMSFMPRELSKNPEARAFTYDMSYSLPKSWDAWADLIHHFVLHLIDRYGIDEVRTWPFEVWNEPDLRGVFWDGDMNDYFKLYESAVRAIKAIDDQIMVGGPATSKNLWIKEFLDFCDHEKVPVDFVSTHHYCADWSLSTGVPTENIRYRGQPQMRKDVDYVKNIIAQSAFPNLDLHYTEWNVSPCHEDRYGKDSEYNATFVL